MKKTTKEREQEIIQYYNSGNSMAKTGENFNISSTTVLNILNRNNIQKRTKGGIYKLPENDIIDFYTKGKSCQEIADYYNVSFHTISDILENNNIARNNRYKNIELDINYFQKIDRNDKAYFLGFLLTDGNVGEKDNSVSLSLALKDKEILEIFSKQIKSSNQLYQRKNREEIKFSVKSKKLKADLAKYGMIPRKTFTAEMPILNEDMMPHLIRGLLDGDGWITKSSNYNTQTIGFCGNEKMVTQVHDFLVKKLNLYNVKIIHAGINLWQCSWASKRDIIKIGNYIYNNKEQFYLKRKYQVFLEIQGNTEITDQIAKG